MTLCLLLVTSLAGCFTPAPSIYDRKVFVGGHWDTLTVGEILAEWDSCQALLIEERDLP